MYLNFEVCILERVLMVVIYFLYGLVVEMLLGERVDVV